MCCAQLAQEDALAARHIAAQHYAISRVAARDASHPSM